MCFSLKSREAYLRYEQKDGEDPRKTVVQFSETDGKKIVGLFNAQGPPVPIPNTEVKLCSAEDTLLATVRENRSGPTR